MSTQKNTFLIYEIPKESTLYTIGDIERPGQIVGKSYAIYEGAPGKPGQDGKDGADGQAATISVGTTTTGEPGTSASVENVGTSTNAILNFTIPQGSQGTPGQDGVGVPQGGTAGQYLVKKSATDYDTEWGTLDTDDIGVTFTFRLANDNTNVQLTSYNYNNSTFYNSFRFNRINWGDGTPIETFESESVQPSTSHTYENAGIYTIRCYKRNALNTHVYISLYNVQNVEAHIGKGVGAFGYKESSLKALDWGYWNSELICDKELLYLVYYPSGYYKLDITIPESVGTICNIKGKAAGFQIGTEKITIKGHPYGSSGPLEWKTISTDCPTLKELIFEQPEVWNLGPSYSPGTLSLPQDTKVIVPWSADHSVLANWKANQYWSPYASQIYEATAPYST